MYLPYLVKIAIFRSNLKNYGLSGVNWDESITLKGLKCVN